MESVITVRDLAMVLVEFANKATDQVTSETEKTGKWKLENFKNEKMKFYSWKTVSFILFQFTLGKPKR